MHNSLSVKGCKVKQYLTSKGTKINTLRGYIAMEDDGLNLDRLTDKCMSQNSTKKWMKLFKEAGDAQARIVKERNENLKKFKIG